VLKVLGFEGLRDAPVAGLPFAVQKRVELASAGFAAEIRAADEPGRPEPRKESGRSHPVNDSKRPGRDDAARRTSWLW
jgi:hypothetical protein